MSTLLLAVLGSAAFYVLTTPSTLSLTSFGPRNTVLTNGETMFNIGGCANCHATPGQDNRLKLGGGLALHTPFGTFKVPNISSDPKVGIGSWTELQFANAILKGVGRNNEHLYPSLPHNRGAYLVEGPGHCAECHSARNILGGIKPSERFAGGADPEGEGWVPNITPHANGLADWSAKDIEFLLETGLRPDSSAVGSGMGTIIRGVSKLTTDDRRAMAAYINALPPRPGSKPPRK
jgi:mono/diheme cytochrome c family protein